MKILIPLAGNGQRFKDDGYKLPKPLVKVLGVPLCFPAIGCLKEKAGDEVWVAYREELDEYDFRGIVTREFAHVKFVTLKYPTRGPVETVLCALREMGDLSEPVLVMDGDTFYENRDVLHLAKNSGRPNAVFYFETKDEQPIFSYVKLGEDFRVIDIKEKDKISNYACSGVYLFESGDFLLRACELLLSIKKENNTEYYISDLYKLMLNEGGVVGSIDAGSPICIGTPVQLKTFCIGRGKDSAYKRFCFDLDGTLCTFPEKRGDYSTVRPIAKTIKLLKFLHKNGHTIIIQTARGMRSSGENPGAAQAKAYREVFSFLEREQIPFDEIYFGKPHADFYIDDLAVSPFGDIEKEIGFYDAVVEARSFNKVEFRNGLVYKKTNNPGEEFWYRNRPGTVREFFPKQHSGPDEEYLITEEVKGVLFSYLFVNGSLTTADVDLLWDTMERIHNADWHYTKPYIKGMTEIERGSYFAVREIDIMANYIPKLTKRWEEFPPIKRMMLTGYGEDIHRCKIEITEKLKEHKPELKIIHGDTVFSNVFLLPDRSLKFIDMRGMVGDELTIWGDVHYDWAKIFQSLLGYDFILTGKKKNEVYCEGLRRHFLNKYKEKYGEEQAKVLPYLTACLILSMIPLHDEFEKRQAYYDMALNLINTK